MKNLKCIDDSRISIILLLVFLVLLTSCVAGRLTKEANMLENNGMYERAAEKWSSILDRNPNNQEALIGLNRSSKKVLERKLESFEEAYDSKDYSKAYDEYLECEKYKKKMIAKGVYLDISNQFTTLFNKINEILAEKHYSRGCASMESKKWNDAINEFENCSKYINGYKDAYKLKKEAEENKNLCEAENEYNDGLAYFNNKIYKKAYNCFATCNSLLYGYKDAKEMMNKSIEKGKNRIAVLPFKDFARSSIEQSLYSNCLSNLISINDPFIEIYDREQIDKIIQEQSFGASGLVDERTATKIGEIAGVSYIITGKITRFTKTGGTVNKSPVRAYEIKLEDPPSSKEITYYIHEGEIRVELEFQFNILDVETGKVLNNKVITEYNSDQCKFATYSGDYMLLNSTDIDLGSSNKSKWAALALNFFTRDIDTSLFCEYKRSLKSADELANEIVSTLAYNFKLEVTRMF